MTDDVMASKVWKVETLRKIDGTCSRFEKPARSLPKEFDSTYYATWIWFDPMNINRKTWQGMYWTPWIIFDIDDENYLENAQRKASGFVEILFEKYEIRPDEIRVVFSTGKGFHVYLDSRIIGLTPSANLHRELTNFVSEFFKENGDLTASKERKIDGVDLSLYDRRHVIGLPGSRHKRTGLFYTPVDPQNFSRMDVEDLLAYSTQPKEFLSRSVDVNVNTKLMNLFMRVREKAPPKSFLPSPSEMVVEQYAPHPFINGISQGGRNNGIFRLAAHYRDKMLSMEEAMILAHHANARSTPTGLPQKEVERHVRTAYKRVLGL